MAPEEKLLFLEFHLNALGLSEMWSIDLFLSTIQISGVAPGL